MIPESAEGRDRLSQIARRVGVLEPSDRYLEELYLALDRYEIAAWQSGFKNQKQARYLAQERWVHQATTRFRAKGFNPDEVGTLSFIRWDLIHSQRSHFSEQ